MNPVAIVATTLAFGVALLVLSGRGAIVAGGILAFVVGDVLKVRRAHVEHSMRRAGIPEPRRTATAMYRALGRGLFELVELAVLPKKSNSSVRVPTEVIESFGDGRRGAVIATAHTGNWDLVACAIAAQTPLTVVTKHLRLRVLDRLWQGARSARGVRLVATGNAASAVRAALARGELAAMVMDQSPERARGVIRVPFLGAPAWVDLAPALAAARARVPLVVAFPRRRHDGSHDVNIAAIIDPPPRPSREWTIAAMTEATRLLETFVRAHPEQWLWMHRRWKEAPESPSAARHGRRLAGVSS